MASDRAARSSTGATRENDHEAEDHVADGWSQSSENDSWSRASWASWNEWQSSWRDRSGNSWWIEGGAGQDEASSSQDASAGTSSWIKIGSQGSSGDWTDVEANKMKAVEKNMDDNDTDNKSKIKHNRWTHKEEAPGTSKSNTSKRSTHKK